MKTLKTISLVLLAVFTLSQCTYAQKDDAEFITEQRDVKNFKGIKVQEGIKVVLTMGSSERVEVVAKPEQMKLVLTEVSGDVLKIHLKENIRRPKITVNVDAKTIKYIAASSGAGVRTTNAVKGDELEMHASSGANLEIALQAQDASCDVSSGAHAHLKGAAKSLNLDASSGAHIKAEELEAEKAEADVSSGAHIHMHATKELEADASSGGSIRYKGEPVKVDADKSSGGSVKPL